MENENNVFLEALGLQSGTTPPIEGGESGAGAGAPVGIPEGFEPKFFGEEFTNWDTVKTEIPQRLSRLNELQQEVEALKSSQMEFASPEIAEFNSFAKNTGLADYGVFNQIKTITPEGAPIDLMVLKQVMENPAYRGKEADLKAKIMKDYEIDPELYTAQEIELNNIRLIDDAKKAGEWLSELKGKMQVVAPDPEALKTKKLEREEAWRTEIQTLVSKLDKLPVPIPNGDKFESLEDFVVKEEIRNRYIEPLFKGSSGLELNDNNRQLVERQLRNELIVENLPYLIDHAIKLSEAKLNKMWEEKTGTSLGNPKEPGGGSHGGSEDIVDRMLRESR